MENILVNEDGLIKLFDFSNSFRIDSLDESTWPKIQNLQCNVPPEILNLQKNKNTFQIVKKMNNIDYKRADVFSLGVLLYQLIFLQSPFKSGQPLQDDKYYKYIYLGETQKFWK